ncbi:MAG: hypothetical protein KDI79_02240 [Anaerolineae bacterium]|nr:hypothetical protein [Anaerolineae bacterium]
MNLTVKTPDRRSNRAKSGNLSEQVVNLQPLAMRLPNRFGIYCPSKFEPKKTMTYREFLKNYADHPRRMRVCFDENPTTETLLERSEVVTAYGSGLDCWYCVDTSGE